MLKSADATRSISNPMPAARKRPQLKSKTSHSFRSRSKARRLRISIVGAGRMGTALGVALRRAEHHIEVIVTKTAPGADRKSTRLNSSHGYISYAVFCLKKKN